MSRGGAGLGQGRKALPPEEKKQTLSVRVHPSIKLRLAEEAKKTGRSQAELVETALRKSLRMK